MKKKNTLHLFISSCGGVGTTRLATLFSEITNSEIVDASLVSGARNYNGVETYFDLEEKGLDPQKIIFYTEDLSQRILQYFWGAHKQEKHLSLVIDTGSTMGIELLNFIKGRPAKEYYDALKRTNTDIIIHPVVSLLSYNSSIKILDQISEAIPEQFENIKVSTWVNFYHSVNVTTEQKDYIHKALEKKLFKFNSMELFVGEHSPLIKKTIDMHMRERTFEYLSSNRPQNCDDFICFGNARQYYHEMKTIIMEKFGTEGEPLETNLSTESNED